MRTFMRFAGPAPQQNFHATLDLISDRSYGIHALAGRILEIPILIALSRVVRASIAAAHSDHDISSLDVGVAKQPWLSGSDIDTDLSHNFDYGRTGSASAFNSGAMCSA
jgi:hypothetical protein